MIARQIPACQNCPYKPVDLQLSKSSAIHGVKTSVMDIDFLWEVGKDFAMLAELKHYSNGGNYDYFYLPANQYVALKKIALRLNADPYFIVRTSSRYFVHRIDVDEVRYSVERFGKSVILFSKEEFRVFSKEGLRKFLIDTYVR